MSQLKWGHEDVDGRRHYFAEGSKGVYTLDRLDDHEPWELWFLREGGEPKDIEFVDKRSSYKPLKEKAEKHHRDYTPNRSRKAKRNARKNAPLDYLPNASISEHQILGRIGDVDPIEYGGGIVFQTEYGPVLEYTRGLEGEDVDAEDDHEHSAKLPLYRVDIDDDALKDLSWLKPDDLKSIARTMDRTVSDLRKAAKSSNVMERVSFYEDVAGYYGWDNIDHYPFEIAVVELNERWYGEED